MPYASVDSLQNLLAKDVFHYAKDAKKAAGRALGTLVEIITFYCLKSWGFERHTAIERQLPEFANADITHNVEYSLHSATILGSISFKREILPLTARKILKHEAFPVLRVQAGPPKSNALLTKDLILRNSCTICDTGRYFVNAYLDDFDGQGGRLTLAVLRGEPFAIFECKRVGVEEGTKKGPQTIEKAKQGAYVAKAISSLQKVRLNDGRVGGLIQKRDGTFRCEEYYSLMAEIITSDDVELFSRLILAVGVVSNHGNWFTSAHHNKELKILAQSYDWLLFLTDTGIAQFVDDLLLNPQEAVAAARDAFVASYRGGKRHNRFTKVQLSLGADAALQSYFADHADAIANWFNVIAPRGKGLAVLKDELTVLKNKKLPEIGA